MPITVLILMIIAVYYPTIFYGWVMDDENWVDRIKNGFFNNLKGIDFIKIRLYGAGTFGLNTKVDHAFTILMHIIICCLIYIALGMNEVSFNAAFLYSLNPINHPTSIWLNGRRYAINIILMLLAILVFSHGIIGKICALILYMSTALFQVTAFFMPVLFGAIPTLTMAVFLLLFGKKIRQKMIDRSSEMTEGEQKIFSPLHFIVMIKSFGFYFCRMLIPGVCVMIYPDFFYWGKSEEGNKNAYAFNFDWWRGVGAIACITSIGILAPNASKPWVLFMGLAIVQWCNILPFFQVLADRYISLANVFMMFFLSYFLHQWFHKYDISVVGLICAYYAYMLGKVMAMYKNIVDFYNYHMSHFPAVTWPRTSFIESLMISGKLQEAEGLVRDGLMANRTDFRLLMYGALFSLINNRHDHGIVFLDEALKHLDIGQEKDQTLEVDHLRKQFSVLKYLKGGK